MAGRTLRAWLLVLTPVIAGAIGAVVFWMGSGC